MDAYDSFTNPADREKTFDLLFTVKHLADSYNSFASESSNKNLRQDLLTILEDEHQMEFRLFDEIQKRGWCTVEFANQGEIDSVSKDYNKKLF